MAMMHVAMADAVASIHPTHKPYAVRVTGHRGSDKVAAAASAAASSCGCSRKPTATRRCVRRVARAGSGRKEKDRGIALGDEVAAQIVALRENDGSSMGLTYTPPTGLGYWQPDPRTGASPFLSSASVTPWTMDTADQFRPKPPPTIHEQRFADDLAELKAIGGVTSSVRTFDQECTARFTTDNPVAQCHRLARIVAQAVPSDLEHDARVRGL